jgi:hypothetical protein
LEYHSHDMQELNDGTVCIPLTTDNIEEGKKAWDVFLFRWNFREIY